MVLMASALMPPWIRAWRAAAAGRSPEARWVSGGAAFSEGQVVFGGTAFVSMAFNLHVPALLFDHLCCASQHLLAVRTQIGFVIVEEDVCDVLGEELIVSDGWGWGESWRRRGCWF